MRNFVPLLLPTLLSGLSCFSSTLADTNQECKGIKTKSASTRLNSDIRCYLDQSLGIFRNSKATVNIMFYMRTDFLNFDEYDNNLEFQGFFFTQWDDETIRWNYTSYGDVRWMFISSDNTWTPGISVLSSGNDKTDGLGIEKATCKVYYNGQISCINMVRRNILCETDFKLWPYDRQKCTMVITSWAYTSEEITLGLDQDTFYMRFKSTGEWDYFVSHVHNEVRRSSYYEDVNSPRISIEFVADRRQTHLRGRYVAPAIIMMVMTLTTLWLDPKSVERVSIASLNIIIHMVCIQDLHWTLPHNGSTVPNLLLFYVNSFVFATVALLLTFILGKIKDSKVTAPKWISSNTTLVLRSKAGQYLLLGMLDPKATAGIEVDADDTLDLMDTRPKETAWTYVAVLIGWISFLGFFFAYIIMYAVLIPTSPNTPLQSVRYTDDYDDDY